MPRAGAAQLSCDGNQNAVNGVHASAASLSHSVFRLIARVNFAAQIVSVIGAFARKNESLQTGHESF